MDAFIPPRRVLSPVFPALGRNQFQLPPVAHIQWVSNSQCRDRGWLEWGIQNVGKQGRLPSLTGAPGMNGAVSLAQGKSPFQELVMKGDNPAK